MEHIKSQLKQLKAITPDRDFAARAKLQILGGERPAIVTLPHFSMSRSSWAWIGAGLSIALIAVVMMIPLAFPEQTYASLDVGNIANEYGNLPINIQLKEISYEQNVNRTIATALTEVSDTKATHLNAEILKTEQAQTALPESSTTDVDAMLQQIMN